MKQKHEIEEMWQKAAELEGQPSKAWGMTYEQGVAAALAWVIQGGESPLDD